MAKTSFEKTQLAPFAKKAKNISLLFMSFFIAMLFLPWEQTTKGTGVLIAYEPTERDYTILSPIAGFIKNFHVKENEFVKEGSLLFEMVDLDAEYLEKLKDIQNDIQTEYKNTKNLLTIAQEQKKNLEENLQTGLQIHDKKISQIQDSLRTLANQEKREQNNYEISTTNYNRIKQLYKEGIESKRSYEVAHNEYIKSKAILDTIQINIQREKKSLEIGKKEKQRYQKLQENIIKTAQNNIINYENRLKNLNKEMTQSSINISRNSSAKAYATKDGYVLRVLKNDKDHYIKKADPLIHFAPKVTKRAVLLKIRSLDMPLIKKGLKVRIQFYGWPSMQVSGWPKITFGTFGGIVEKIDSIAYEDGVFYAYVTEDPSDPWPNSEVLKVGTKATAWIRLSTVPIWYEIWRLHNALPIKMLNLEEK
jgi:multidrug efflux pump subunit AcrA (membrane-fusion protein)